MSKIRGSGTLPNSAALDDLTRDMLGKLFGDKGYISKDWFNKLYARGLRLFTGLRKDMKNYLLELEDKILLRKRSLVESVFNVLKNSMHLEHTRSRSPTNYLVHIISYITAYAIQKSNFKFNNMENNSMLLS